MEDRERGFRNATLGREGQRGDRQNGQDEEVHGDAAAEGLAEALGPAAPTAAGLLSGTDMIFSESFDKLQKQKMTKLS